MSSRRKGTGTIFRPKGSRFYWVAYYSGGRRRFEGTKSERKQEAQALLTQRLGDSQNGIVVTPKIGRRTLADGLQAVVNDLRVNGKDSVVCTRCKVACCGVEGHSNSISRQIDMHIIWHVATDDAPEGGYFRADRLMSTIATSDLTAYVVHRLGQGAAAATVNKELAVIRRAFRLAVRGKELLHMPHVPMLTLNNARKGFLERHEFDAICDYLPAEYQAPVRFAFTTGWRLKSEVLPLTVDRVDLTAGVVRLDPGTTKNNEGRSFHMTAEPRKVLTAQLDAVGALKEQDVICPWVFHRPDGSRIADFRKAWKVACTKAGYPGKLFHDFRRSAIRTIERAGVPRTTAMKMVGHKTESIYRRYAIVDEQMHREAAAKLDAWADDQKGKAKREKQGQLRRFTRRQAGGNG